MLPRASFHRCRQEIAHSAHHVKNARGSLFTFHVQPPDLTQSLSSGFSANKRIDGSSRALPWLCSKVDACILLMSLCGRQKPFLILRSPRLCGLARSERCILVTLSLQSMILPL